MAIATVHVRGTARNIHRWNDTSQSKLHACMELTLTSIITSVGFAPTPTIHKGKMLASVPCRLLLMTSAAAHQSRCSFSSAAGDARPQERPVCAAAGQDAAKVLEAGIARSRHAPIQNILSSSCRCGMSLTKADSTPMNRVLTSKGGLR